ncbi:MAG: PHP domain-containing protein [Prolixibacteraceae bacterium]|jgi:PHP family Zn ribbon phosphoesterase|nr:PHP domain-containing protein [Prolixibacteraceae bacterium]
MQSFKADLHIHTLLSPCGSLEMSPNNIVEKALEEQLNIIAITDHNSTKQAALIKEIAEEKGIYVLLGAEINSVEEVHCLTFFETVDQLNDFQDFIDQHILSIPNKPESFGDQIVVDKDEMIIEEVKYSLVSALNATLLEIEQKAHQIGGLVVPAHIDRPYNGLLSQLGFIPENLTVDAFEVSKHANVLLLKNKGKLPDNATVITSSDAHHPNQIGEVYTIFNMEELSFQGIKRAFLKNRVSIVKSVGK